MAKLPPIPPGFEEVPDTSVSDAPPVPKGFEVVKEAQPTPVDDETYKNNLDRILSEGGGGKQLDEYSKSVGRDITTKEYKALRDFADAGGGPHKWNIPDTPMMQAIEGGFRGLQNPLEGAAQLGMNLSEKMGMVPKGTYDGAQAALGAFTEQQNAAHVRGVAGNVAEFAGELPMLAAVPMMDAIKVGEGAAGLASLGKQILSRRGASLAASGAVTGAVAGGATKTSGEQDLKALAGAGLGLLGVPLFEKLVEKAGVPLARRFVDRLSTGVGKTLFKADGSLTSEGLMLRTRLKHASPGLDDDIIDAALHHIRATNPKRLPDTKAIVPEMIAQREGVPLVEPMKTGDVKGMQDFESAMAGATPFKKVLGTQDNAVAADKAIDEAILANVEKVKGSNATSDEAADATMNKVGVAAKAAQDAKSAAYEKVNHSREVLLKPTQLIGLRNEFIDAAGQSAVQRYKETGDPVMGYINQLGAMGRSKKTHFGELWGMIQDVRKEAGKVDAKQPIKDLAYRLNAFLDSSAPPGMFASGSNGVFKDLRDADALNRVYKTKFSPQNRKSLTDVAGKRVESIVSMYADPAQASPDKIEKILFGQAKGIGGKETQVTIKRLVKAAPGVQQHIREMGMNRLIGQITDALSSAGGERGISPANAAKVISSAVNDSVGTLKAMGLSEAEIQSLRNNGYLAAKKINAIGARSKGSSATNRAIPGDIRRILNKALWAGLPSAGVVLHGGSGAIAVAGTGLVATGVVSGASLLSAKKAAKKFLSTAPLKATPALTAKEAKLVANVARTATSKSADKIARDRGQ